MRNTLPFCNQSPNVYLPCTLFTSIKDDFGLFCHQSEPPQLSLIFFFSWPRKVANFFFLDVVKGCQVMSMQQQDDNGVDTVKEAFLNLLCKVNEEEFDEFDTFVRSALG